MKIEFENIDDKNRKLIRKWIKSVLTLAKKQISLKDAVIKVARTKNSEDYKELKGIGGYCPSDSLIQISVDESNSGFGFDSFALTLTHELNHLARRQSGIKTGEDTFMECLISEGLADYFCHQLFGKYPVWIKNQDDATIKRYLKLSEPIINIRMTDKLYKTWFTTGSKKQNIPKWAGYDLGLYLTSRIFRKNKSQKMSELIKLSASDI